jgi:hypothetical protein
MSASLEERRLRRFEERSAFGFTRGEKVSSNLE